MHYSLHKGLEYRQVGNQCLVYSNQSRETLLVHSMAFRLIELINQAPQTFESLCDAMANMQDISASEEQDFIRVTLEKFTDLGIIKCIH